MIDYQPRRMEFLWVRWYERIEATSTGWDDFKLHRVRFLPVADENAFGFIDPMDIIRSCHIIPYFFKGKRHTDGRCLSRCAGDSSDWVAYTVNQFVDRDMIMRYFYGLGVGHAYAYDRVQSIYDQSAAGHSREHLESGRHSDDEHVPSSSYSDRTFEFIHENPNGGDDSVVDSDSMGSSDSYPTDDEACAMEEMYG
jgi:hypothetical protein